MEVEVYLSELFKNVIWPDYSKAPNKNTNKVKDERTLKDYLRNVHYICARFGKDFIDIQAEEARSYFEELSEQKKYKVKSLTAILVSLRNLSGYIAEHKEKYALLNYRNVFITVPTPQYDTYVRESDLPTDDDIEQIMKACEDDMMQAVIFKFINLMGLSASEICCLSQGQIKIDGAGRYYIDFSIKSRSRFVKIHEDALDSFLKYYIPNTNPDVLARDSTPLFINKRGNRIQVRNLEMYLAAAVKRAGINKHITLQDLRNAATVKMLANGAPADSVAEYTGISDRWIYRYNRVLHELDNAPCDYI